MPEAGQSEQTQRVEVSVQWDTRSIWTMSARVDDEGCPNQRATWVAFSKKGRRSPKVMTKRYVKCWKQRLNYKKN